MLSSDLMKLTVSVAEFKRQVDRRVDVFLVELPDLVAREGTLAAYFQAQMLKDECSSYEFTDVADRLTSVVNELRSVETSK